MYWYRTIISIRDKMDTQQNNNIMKRAEQIARIKEVIQESQTCMMVTLSDKNIMSARPMAKASFEQNAIWFFTDLSSDKVSELRKEQDVLLTISKPEENTFLTIKAISELDYSLAKKEKFFNPFVRAWFPDGPESESLVLVKCSIKEVEIWDSTSHKIPQLLKIGKALISGEKYETSDDENYTISFA